MTEHNILLCPCRGKEEQIAINKLCDKCQNKIKEFNPRLAEQHPDWFTLNQEK